MQKAAIVTAYATGLNRRLAAYDRRQVSEKVRSSMKLLPLGNLTVRVAVLNVYLVFLVFLV
ncbi:MAG: hypothetical protein ACJAYC_003258 [Halieaceae bacterium]|jgi:hypothetical protein